MKQNVVEHKADNLVLNPYTVKTNKKGIITITYNGKTRPLQPKQASIAPLPKYVLEAVYNVSKEFISDKERIMPYVIASAKTEYEGKVAWNYQYNYFETMVIETRRQIERLESLPVHNHYGHIMGKQYEGVITLKHWK